MATISGIWKFNPDFKSFPRIESEINHSFTVNTIDGGYISCYYYQEPYINFKSSFTGVSGGKSSTDNTFDMSDCPDVRFNFGTGTEVHDEAHSILMQLLVESIDLKLVNAEVLEAAIKETATAVLSKLDKPIIAGSFRWDIMNEGDEPTWKNEHVSGTARMPNDLLGASYVTTKFDYLEVSDVGIKLYYRGKSDYYIPNKGQSAGTATLDFGDTPQVISTEFETWIRSLNDASALALTLLLRSAFPSPNGIAAKINSLPKVSEHCNNFIYSIEYAPITSVVGNISGDYHTKGINYLSNRNGYNLIFPESIDVDSKSVCINISLWSRHPSSDAPEAAYKVNFQMATNLDYVHGNKTIVGPDPTKITETPYLYNNTYGWYSYEIKGLKFDTSLNAIHWDSLIVHWYDSAYGSGPTAYHTISSDWYIDIKIVDTNGQLPNLYEYK